MNLFSLHKNDRKITRVSSNTTVLPNRYSFKLVRRETITPIGKVLPDTWTLQDKILVEPVKTVPVEAVMPPVTPVKKVTRAVVDEDKRGFLKLAGVLGLGALAATALPQKAQAYVMGSSPTSGVVGLKNAANNRIDPALEGGNLASIKTNTDTFSASSAGAYIRQDSNATIARESGGNLATLAGKDFATQTTLAAIKTQTDKFTFSGSNLLTTGSGGGATTLQDTSGTQINPATDDSLQYLRRMVKIMESQAAVDSANRQRITLDSLGTGTAITTTVPVSGTVTATVTGATLGAGTAAIGSVNIDGQGRQMFQDFARQAYNSGIRGNLIFS